MFTNVIFLYLVFVFYFIETIVQEQVIFFIIKIIVLLTLIMYLMTFLKTNMLK